MFASLCATSKQMQHILDTTAADENNLHIK